MESRLAVVTTIKHVTEQTPRWIEHHLKLVQKLFVFIDHPSENFEFQNILAQKYGTERLQFFHKNEKLIQSWESFPIYESIRNLVDRFVTLRQALNIEYLLRVVKVSNFDWIFHLDDDEMLYFSKKDCTLSEYLSKVPDRYDQLVLQNYEAIPTELDADNFFATQRIFKKSPPMVSFYQLELLKEKLERPYYFTSYNHGKCAFSPKKLIDRGLYYPDGVHRFHVDEEKSLDCNFLDLAVLHYPFPSFGMYYGKFSGLNRKRVYEYEALGSSDQNFYSESRKLFFQANPLEIEHFYSSNVVYSRDELALLKDLKLILEIEGEND